MLDRKQPSGVFFIVWLILETRQLATGVLSVCEHGPSESRCPENRSYPLNDLVTDLFKLSFWLTQSFDYCGRCRRKRRCRLTGTIASPKDGTVNQKCWLQRRWVVISIRLSRFNPERAAEKRFHVRLDNRGYEPA